MQKNWHAVPLTEVFSQTESSHNGLTSQEASLRLAKNGKNVLPSEKPLSKLRLFFSQFNNPLMYILLATVVISFSLKHYSDGIFIIIVLLINTTVGFYQENKANQSLLVLKKMVKIKAKVKRDGNKKEIDSDGLVVGDIVFLRPGDKAPADGRIIDSKGLKINEAGLTGESQAVEKRPVDTLYQQTLLPERTNMAFMATIVEEGQAVIVIVSTGINTQIGEVVSLLQRTKERQTPLQRKILSLSKFVGVFILSIIFVIVILGCFTQKSFADIFVASMALAVSATPSGLLPAITVILVLGMRRIFKQNGLVRKLAATETLGRVTVICTDKTGTLTEGKMQVSHILTSTRELFSEVVKETLLTPGVNTDFLTGLAPLERTVDAGGFVIDNNGVAKKNFLTGLAKGENANGLESHIAALKIAVLANEAFVENPEAELQEWVVRGKPTEQALLLAGMQAGLNKKELEKQYPLLDRISFESDLKYAASLHYVNEKENMLYVIGAPEEIIARSVDLDIDGRKEKLGDEQSSRLLKKMEALTQKGLRVLACGHKDYDATTKYQNLNGLVKELSLVGFIALKDPLRQDAKESILTAKKAGIRTIIVTGDHKLTARAIAQEIGLPAEDHNILEGKEIEALFAKDLQEKSKHIFIYARVSPNHKLRIVDALQANGEVVAMLGDGVNDAPALKAADIGVAVGSGTDVAKEVADLVLLDDNFKTIVKAIEQGRMIFENIRKVFVYLVADDFSELFLFLACLAMGLPLPLLAAQILWINIVEDGLPDIALTTEQESKGVMEEKPISSKEPILNKPLKLWMAAVFLISGLAAFLSFLIFWKLSGDIHKTRTMIFVLMGFDSLVFAFSVRSFKRSIFRKDIFSNRYLLGGVTISLLLLVGAVYLPPLQKLLATQALSITQWLVIFSMGLIEIILIEFSKKRIFRYRAKQTSLPFSNLVNMKF